MQRQVIVCGSNAFSKPPRFGALRLDRTRERVGHRRSDSGRKCWTALPHRPPHQMHMQPLSRSQYNGFLKGRPPASWASAWCERARCRRRSWTPSTHPAGSMPNTREEETATRTHSTQSIRIIQSQHATNDIVFCCACAVLRRSTSSVGVQLVAGGSGYLPLLEDHCCGCRALCPAAFRSLCNVHNPQRGSMSCQHDRSAIDIRSTLML